jgi:NADH:quinone reductase (non-electrogenic)
VVPLRTVLKRTNLVTGTVTAVDHNRRIATIEPLEGRSYDIPYDVIVVALGSVSRVLPIPGLVDAAVGFKTVEEAIYLRNHILECMDAAESTDDEIVRRRVLTFVFVGGGYAGVEALAELEDLARDASRKYSRVDRADMRWVLIEAAPMILPEMAPDMGPYATRILRERGIEVLFATTLESASGGRMLLSNGEEFEADTLVWTAGVRPHPLVAELGLPIDERGRVVTDRYLRVMVRTHPRPSTRLGRRAGSLATSRPPSKDNRSQSSGTRTWAGSRRSAATRAWRASSRSASKGSPRGGCTATTTS